MVYNCMARRSLQEEILEAFLIALDEKLDKRNTYTSKDIDREEGEFQRAGIDPKKVAKGRGVTLPNLKGVGNTDAEDINKPATRFGKMKQWARTMQANKLEDPDSAASSEKAGRVIPSKEDRIKTRQQRRAVHTQVKTDTDRPSVIATTGRGGRELVGGNTRASLRRLLGKPIKAHIFKNR